MEKHDDHLDVTETREERQNELNHLIADGIGDKDKTTCENLKDLIRSQTETMSLATTLDSTLYNTPMTSFSGFDVYLTAEEGSSYSLSRKSNGGLNEHVTSDYQISSESKDNTENERRIQLQGSEPNLVVKSAVNAFKRSGKGGERIGESGKYSPKKMADVPVTTKKEKKDHVKTNHEQNNVKQNGSLKVHVPEFPEDDRRHAGGTKAILIQKVGLFLSS